MNPIYYCHMNSPIGELLLAGDGESLQQVMLAGESRSGSLPGDWLRRNGVFDEPRRQLLAYFTGELQHFTLKLTPRGSDFQQQVWSALTEIPYGETRSYADIARRINRPTAVRAVGAAAGRNPLPIVVPCHRVIGSNGGLVGFAGGLPAKAALLELEQSRSFALTSPSAGPV